MSSRVSLSILGFLFGSLSVYALVSAGYLPTISFEGLHPIAKIACLLIAVAPVVGWFTVFLRLPSYRGGTG